MTEAELRAEYGIVEDDKELASLYDKYHNTLDVIGLDDKCKVSFTQCRPKDWRYTYARPFPIE